MTGGTGPHFIVGDFVTPGCGYDHLTGVVAKIGTVYLHIFVPAWNKTVQRKPTWVQRRQSL